MPETAFYRGLHRLLEDVTPLRFDCGRLCGAACCRPGPELPGMFLFPGEEALYEDLPGFTVKPSVLPGYGPALLLDCGGRCTRETRPLSCRIFPLAPKLAGGVLQVRADPRGIAVCPLARQGAGAVSAAFADAAGRVFASLLTRSDAGAFLEALSRHLDEFGQPL